MFFCFFRSMEKMPEMAPNGARMFFFRLIQTLPTFWAEWKLILRTSMSRISLDSNFRNVHVSMCLDVGGNNGQTPRSQPDPSCNTPKNQIRCKESLLRLRGISSGHKLTSAGEGWRMLFTTHMQTSVDLTSVEKSAEKTLGRLCCYPLGGWRPVCF